MVRATIERVFSSVYEEQQQTTPPELNDDLVLLESGMDSLAFAILVAQLDEELGYDPFTISDQPYYPQTFGQFVSFYESNAPS